MSVHPSDKPEFVKLLGLCYSTLLRPLPPLDSIDLWMTILEQYSFDQVRVALSAHMRESKFPPMPADVVGRMPKRSDGHLDAAEAWAIARNARDEGESVCWTQQMAEALAVTRNLDGDEYAARTAFAAKYTRLVEAARSEGKAAVWFMSWGYDASKREAVALVAVREGRLQLEHARKVVPQLAAPTVEDTPQAQVQRADLLRLVSTIPSHAERLMQQRGAESEAEREATEEAKRQTAELVAKYKAGQ